MKDRTLNIILSLGLVALIGGMSWKDMHPVSKPPALSFSYYAGADIAPEMVPEARGPLYVFQGTFAKDGWQPAGMPPSLFPQRQINLVFGLRELPKDPATVLDKITSVINAWAPTGSSVEGLAFDYRPAKPDFASYARFLKAAQERFKNKQYLIAVTDPSWLAAGRLKELRDHAPLFLMPLAAAEIPPALQTALKQQDDNIALQLPAGTDTEALPPVTKEALFTAFAVAVTLDKADKPARKVEQARLFPKIFY